MPAELRCEVDRDSPYAVVRVSGVLERSTATTLRHAIAKCLAAQPTAILVELSEFRIGDASALSVLAAAAREAAQWPGAPLLLCSPDQETSAVLGRSAVCRQLPVFPTLEAAVTGVDGIAPVELRTTLMPSVGAARRARELVTEACARWELPGLVGPACTVVTELVNNVVVHVGSPMEVTLRLRDRRVTVSVRDDSTEPPQPRGPVTPTSPGGRGLMMVAAVAEGWGHMPVAGGKVVWALLRTDRSR